MQVDIELLKEFERGLNPARPEQSRIPVTVLGYGEISTIFEIQADGARDVACKRLPLFQSEAEIKHYEQIYHDYNQTLKKKIGLNIPNYDFVSFTTDAGKIIAFVLQQKLPSSSIGNRAIHLLNTDDIRILFMLVLKELSKVWSYNAVNPGEALGIDGQISNWAVEGFDPGKPSVGPDSRLFYFDTSTPLMKKGGVEQLDPELFLRSAPSFMRWLIRWLFLKGVMTRYYDPRLVTIDLIANFYKEQRPEMVPILVKAANGFFSTEGMNLVIAPLTEKEIKSYYKEDAMIWIVFLTLRRFDRWLHRYILHKPYAYILPGKIKR